MEYIQCSFHPLNHLLISTTATPSAFRLALSSLGGGCLALMSKYSASSCRKRTDWLISAAACVRMKFVSSLSRHVLVSFDLNDSSSQKSM